MEPIASVRLTKPMPRSFRLPAKARRSFTLRPRRSSFQTTRVSPARRTSSAWAAVLRAADSIFNDTRGANFFVEGDLFVEEELFPDGYSMGVATPYYYEVLQRSLEPKCVMNLLSLA